VLLRIGKKSLDSHIFIVGNDVIWTQVCVVESGNSEIKVMGVHYCIIHKI
jgi:hypothetical protein